MSVRRSQQGFTVLDQEGFVVGYALTYQEAMAILEANK